MWDTCSRESESLEKIRRNLTTNTYIIRINLFEGRPRMCFKSPRGVFMHAEHELFATKKKNKNMFYIL